MIFVKKKKILEQKFFLFIYDVAYYYLVFLCAILFVTDMKNDKLQRKL